MFRNLTLRTKLTCLFLIIGLVPIAVIGYLDYRRGCGILERETLDQLIGIREDRKAQIGDFFRHLRLDMEVLSDHRLLKDIFIKYNTAHDKVGFSGEAFRAVDARYHGRCVDLCKKYGYEDMLFVNNKGDVLITVKKYADWGKNLKMGAYSDTNLAECYENALSGTSMVDFKRYPPSGKPAAFIGSPIISHIQRAGLEAGERIGVLIIRISVDQINAIMQRKEGLGDTGETYLVGSDLFMRSDSRFLKESAILSVKKVDTVTVKDALEERSGYREKIIDYRGVPVFSVYAPAEIEGLNWVIVAEKDVKEIVKPVLMLRNNTLLVGLIVAVAVVGAQLFFVAGIIIPIKRIKQAAHNIAAGDLATRLDVKARDEIGELADSFNRMAQRLMESRTEIESYSRSLEKKVEARTADLMKRTEDLEKSNHVLASYNDILTVLNAELEIDPLLDEILGRIATWSDSQLGVIYLYEEEKRALLPAATYAVGKGLIVPEFKLGNGLPGQAAAAKKTILVEDVPEEYFRISAGSFEGAPKNVICIPIVFRDQLMGVLELGVIRGLAERDLEFLNVIASQLGVGIHNTLSYVQLKKLSADLQEKNEVLAVQNEELQAQNEEIQAQSEELRSQAEELAVGKKQLEEKTRMARDADRLKSEFLSNMSHELRTPLNALLGMSRLLSTGTPGEINEKQRGYLNVIEKSGTSLLDLMNDILDLSRIESGVMEIDREEISLKSFITDVAATVSLPVKEKNLILTLDIEEGLSLYSDADKLDHIISNLLENAIKFTEEGEICISAKEQKFEGRDMVAISVRDTGTGISKEALTYIFEPFRQVDGSITRKHGGTGLGLSICKKLVNLLNGKIDVISEAGKGSTFTVTIPKDIRSKFGVKEEEWKEKVKEAFVSGIGAQPEEGYPGDQPAKDRAMKDILLIDDDPTVIRELKIILKEENYRLRVAFDGSEGLQKMKEQTSDLLLLDLRMPGMDGFDMLEELKKNRDWKNIPIIILTAADLAEEEKSRLTGNVKAVITKGKIDRQVLFSSIQEILRGPGNGRLRPVGARAYAPEGVVESSSGRVVESANSRTTGQEEPGPRRAVEKQKGEGPFKIMVVEDESDNMFYTTETLRASGYIICAATDGQEAVETARKERPDLIFMDIQIPVLTGDEATKQIKETEGLKDVPVIALTARTMKGDREKILAAGFDDYLGKPFHPEDLIKKVGEWLGSSSEE
ncbi:MAG: response regulator [Deltaproteobacteria bacterium]|nr:response regulator [Deltaproteobacteria bacterium]